MDGIQALGVKVHREPAQRGFDQPCPLWQGECTIYATPQYPRHCHTYKCKLLRKLMDENIEFPSALEIVKNTIDMIREIESLLPVSQIAGFRERLVSHLEEGKATTEFITKANELLDDFDKNFGVKDY